MDRVQGLGFYVAVSHPEGLKRVVPAPLQPQTERLMVCLVLQTGMGSQIAAHRTGAWKPSHQFPGATWPCNHSCEYSRHRGV